MNMCTKEEAIKIVNDSEKRILEIMHAEMNKLRLEVKEDREKSHLALANTISDFGSQVVTATRELKLFFARTDKEINDLLVWKAVHMSEAKEINSKIDSVLSGLRKIMWIGISAIVTAVLTAMVGVFVAMILK